MTPEQEVRTALLIVQAVADNDLKKAVLLMLHQCPRNCKQLAHDLLDAGAAISIQMVQDILNELQAEGLTSRQ